MSTAGDTGAAMLDQLIAELKRTGYELETREQALKCVAIASRLGLSAQDVEEAFEAFAVTKYADTPS